MADNSYEWRMREPFDRMIDDIAAATSLAEVEYLRREVRREFTGHPRLPDLERVLDGMRRVLTDRATGEGKR